jgi:hypothetical protein
MYREKVRSIGISLLGGNSGVAGKYELGIDSIWIANDEDVGWRPGTSERGFPANDSHRVGTQVGQQYTSSADDEKH